MYVFRRSVYIRVFTPVNITEGKNMPTLRYSKMYLSANTNMPNMHFHIIKYMHIHTCEFILIYKCINKIIEEVVNGY